MRRPIFAATAAIVLMAASSSAVPGFAQNSNFNLNVHANSHATAKDIGLPVYPGAMPSTDSDSSSADLGFLLNSFQLSMKSVSFVTTDSPERVLAYYRKPLAKFGEVLECDHGKPVGSLTETKSGLTCGDRKSGRKTADGNVKASASVTVSGNEDGHELRAGEPEQFRMVGVDGTEKGKTEFKLVALVLPKDEDGK